MALSMAAALAGAGLVSQSKARKAERRISAIEDQIRHETEQARWRGMLASASSSKEAIAVLARVPARLRRELGI